MMIKNSFFDTDFNVLFFTFQFTDTNFNLQRNNNIEATFDCYYRRT